MCKKQAGGSFTNFVNGLSHSGEGDKSGADNWKTHVIKWSHGVNSGEKWVGEKWDHCRFYDLDEDGDLDIVGNAEEFYKRLPNNGHDSYLSVFWFENKLNENI